MTRDLVAFRGHQSETERIHLLIIYVYFLLRCLAGAQTTVVSLALVVQAISQYQRKLMDCSVSNFLRKVARFGNASPERRNGETKDKYLIAAE